MTFTDITAPPHPPPTSIRNVFISSYIRSETGHYWFQLIPETCLGTKDEYIKWLEIMTTSIHSSWAAHCREEITIEKYMAFLAAANTWIKKYDDKFKDE